jgi:hypothetical protein
MKEVLKWIGLIIVSIVAAYYLFIIVTGLFDAQNISLDFESVGMVALSVSTVISVIFVWINPRAYVWMVLIVGVLFSIFAVVTAGSHQLLAIMFAGGPLVIGGVLIYFGTRPDIKRSNVDL